VADCSVKAGEVVVVDPTARKDDCKLEKGSKLRFFLEKPMAAPAEVAPEATPKRAVKARKVKKMPESKKAAEEVAPAPAVAADPVAAAPEAAVAAAPVVAAPVAAPVAAQTVDPGPSAPTADEVTKAMQSAGGGGVGVIAAIVVVAGSAGALKLWKSLSDNKKEVELERIKADAEARKAPDYSTSQPPPCSVKQMETEARLAAMQARIDEAVAKLDKVEKKASSFSADFDGEDIEKRLVKVEKALKAKKV